MSEQTTTQEFKAIMKIQKEDLEKVFTIIKNTVDETQLNISEEGLYTRYMDNQHVSLIDISLSNAIFEKYEANTEGYISITNPEKILKAIQKFDSTITIEADNQSWTLSNKEMSFSFRQKEKIEDDTLLPRIPYDACVEILDVKGFVKNHKTINEFADYITYKTTQNKLILEAKSEELKELRITLESGSMQKIKVTKCLEDTETMYAFDYLMPFLNSIGSSPLVFEYSSHKPVRFETRIANVGRIHYYVAPRVEN